MHKIIELLQKEEAKLIKLKLKLSEINKPNLEGKLEISNTKKYPQYYHVYLNGENKKIKKYLGKGDFDTKRKLAQKSYLEKIESHIDSSLRVIQNCLATYDPRFLDKLYDDLNVFRKELFSPILPTTKQRLEQFKSKQFKRNPKPILKPIKTHDSEIVRSKSEALLYNLFVEFEKVFRYEAALWLSEEIVVYPDFTFIHPITGEIIVWEHFGMVDNTEYAQKMIARIETYAEYGYNIGENLIITFESSTKPLDLDYAKKLIRKYL